MFFLHKKVFLTCVSVSLLLLCACSTKKQNLQSKTDDSSVWNKVKIDFKRLDADGLAGPPSGKVAMNYEFCLPKDPTLWKKAQKIDKTLKRLESKGRIGCSKAEWLCIGSTHQKQYTKVLYDLASMQEIALIQEVFYE